MGRWQGGLNAQTPGQERRGECDFCDNYHGAEQAGRLAFVHLDNPFSTLGDSHENHTNPERLGHRWAHYSQQAFAGPADMLKHQLGGNRAIDAVNKGPGGIGVPGGDVPRELGASILKSAGSRTSIIQAALKVKSKIKLPDAKGSKGQAQGQQTGRRGFSSTDAGATEGRQGCGCIARGRHKALRPRIGASDRRAEGMKAQS